MEANSDNPISADTVEQAINEILCLAWVTMQNGNLNKLEGLVTAAKLLVNALGPCFARETLERLAKLEEALCQQDEDSGWII